MLSSIYVNLKKNISVKKLHNYLKKYHKKNYFIRVMPLNKNIGTENVINTNFCDISICETKQKNKIVILSALDNLIKGASGQAVQNMNILFDYKENLGLK